MALFFNEFLQKEGEVWVTIPDSRDIPLMGKGPFLKPERISEENYKILINLGYKVEKLPARDLLRVPLITRPLKNPLNQGLIKLDNKQEKTKDRKEEKIKPLKEEKIEETVENTVELPKVEEKIEPTQEKVSVRKAVIRQPITKPEVQEEVVQEQEEDDVTKLTKAELKAILDEAGIQYKYESKLSELQELVAGMDK